MSGDDYQFFALLATLAIYLLLREGLHRKTKAPTFKDKP